MLASTGGPALTICKNLYNIGPSTSFCGGASLMGLHPSLRIYGFGPTEAKTFSSVV